MSIKNFFRFGSVAVVLAAASSPAWAVEAFNAEYQASAMGMQGNGQMSVASKGSNRWEYSLSINNSLVDMSQKTVFEDKGGVLRPLSSTDLTRVLIKKKKVSADYDWDQKQVTWTGDVKPGRAGPVALNPGDMDALLVNLAIVRDVAAGKPLTYRLVENGKARPMTYSVAGKENITIAGKTREATKVVRTSGDKETIVWIVAGMPAPARILQREGGRDSIDLQVKSFR